MRHRFLVVSLVLVVSLAFAALLASGTASASFSGVLHTPPTSGRIGQAVPVSVELEGIGSSPASVYLFYRPKGSSNYKNLRLKNEGRGRFTGTMPASGTGAPALYYFIEATDASGKPLARLGSRARPFSVLLFKPLSGSAVPFLFRLGTGLFVLLATVAAVWFVERRRRRRLAEQVFWLRTLGPLTRLSEDKVAGQIARLSHTPLDHPADGVKLFSREQLLAELDAIRHLDPLRIVEERRRYFKDEPLEPVAAAVVMNMDEVRTERASLALLVGRLCAAAWFHSVCRSSADDQGRDFTKPFDDARQTVLRIQKAIDEGVGEKAAYLVRALKRDSARLKALIDELEEDCSAEDLAHRLAGTLAVTTDLLRRLIDYYVNGVERVKENRLKLVAVSAALAKREAAGDGSTARLRRLFHRRGILLETDSRKLNRDLAAQAGKLEERILLIDTSDSGEIASVRGEVEEFTDSLGDALYTLDGLAVALSLHLAVKEATVACERSQAGTFDVLMNDFSGILDVHQGDLPDGEPCQDEDLETLESVHALAAEIRGVILDGTHRQREFHIEEIDVKAVCDEAAEPEWSALVLRALSCRTAIDQLAQKHSAGGRRDGFVPPPLPPAKARTLIRRAAQLERDLQDLIDRDVLRGMYNRAKDGTRVAARLSRARLGLALLGKLPAAG